MVKNTANVSYSKALIEISSEKEILDSVFDDISMVSDVLKNNIVIKALRIPSMSHREKMSVLNDILERIGVKNKEVYRFIELLIKKNKEKIIVDILEDFQYLYYKQKGVENIEIISTKKLSEKNKKGILSILGLNIENVNLEETLDDTLIGGFVLKHEGRIYDTSVKRKLIDIKNNINI